MAMEQIDKENGLNTSYDGKIDFKSVFELLGIKQPTGTEIPTEPESPTEIEASVDTPTETIINESGEVIAEDATSEEIPDTETELLEVLAEQDGKKEVEGYEEGVAIIQDLYDLQHEILGDNNIA